MSSVCTINSTPSIAHHQDSSTIYWMVVWLPFFIFPYIGNNHPNWLIFFQRGSNHQPDLSTYNHWCMTSCPLNYQLWVSKSWVIFLWRSTFYGLISELTSTFIKHLTGISNGTPSMKKASVVHNNIHQPSAWISIHQSLKYLIWLVVWNIFFHILGC